MLYGPREGLRPVESPRPALQEAQRGAYRPTERDLYMDYGCAELRCAMGHLQLQLQLQRWWRWRYSSARSPFRRRMIRSSEHAHGHADGRGRGMRRGVGARLPGCSAPLQALALALALSFSHSRSSSLAWHELHASLCELQTATPTPPGFGLFERSSGQRLRQFWVILSPSRGGAVAGARLFSTRRLM